MREKIYLLTFSADLQALCTPATKDFLIPPHFYKGIQKHFYHPNFSPFTNCLQTKKKHLSLLLPIQKRFERTFFHFFYFCFSQRKKPLTFHGTSEALLPPQMCAFYKLFTFQAPFLRKMAFFKRHLSFE